MVAVGTSWRLERIGFLLVASTCLESLVDTAESALPWASSSDVAPGRVLHSDRDAYVAEASASMHAWASLNHTSWSGSDTSSVGDTVERMDTADVEKRMVMDSTFVDAS